MRNYPYIYIEQPDVQGRKRVGPAMKLAEALRKLVDEQIEPRRARFGNLADVWDKLLPAELRKHCRIADISAGRLIVQVDSSSYMCELRFCGTELVKQLQKQCPRARIREIGFTLG